MRSEMGDQIFWSCGMPCLARIFVKEFVKDAQPQLDGRALGHALRLERALVVERLAKG